MTSHFLYEIKINSHKKYRTERKSHIYASNFRIPHKSRHTQTHTHTLTGYIHILRLHIITLARNSSLEIFAARIHGGFEP